MPSWPGSHPMIPSDKSRLHGFAVRNDGPPVSRGRVMLGRSAPSFPRFLSKRQFDFKRFKQFTVRACPLLKAIEGVSRPRWNARHDVMYRFVGLVVFLLALSAGWPLPLVNVIPGMAVVLIAIAYL